MFCRPAAIVSALLLPIALAAGVTPTGLRAQAPAPASAAPPAAAAPAAAKVALAEPGISPDGREIAFVSGGDIWTVAATGGDAHLLVSHQATESRPLYAPDGRSLAFSSTRSGNGDIYVLTLDTGDLRRLTYDDGAEQPTGWSPDGRWVYFQSASQDLGGMADIFRMPAAGGTAMPVTSDAYFNEFFGVVSPDGRRLAFNARGIAANQWWRRGHSHIDEAEVWLATLDTDTPTYHQVTTRGAKSLWPMWSADGRSLFYVSDRGSAGASRSGQQTNGAHGTRDAIGPESRGPENIWRVSVPAAPTDAGPAAEAARGERDGRAVTTFTDGRVLWPTISRDGKTIAFERDFAIWTLDTASGRAQPLTIARRGAPAGPGVDHQRLTNGFQDLALSPDGKKIAFSARGDLFAAAAKDGGDAARITTTTAVEGSPVWAPDSRRLVYVAEAGVTSELHVYEFGGADTTLTTGHRDYAPAIAPNGEQVAFLRGGAELCLVSLAGPASKAARCLTKATLPASLDATHVITWSPDSRWIAFVASGAKGFTNAHVVAAANGPAASGTATSAAGARNAAASGEARPVSFLANVSGDSIAWSPDGTFLLFNTGQRTEQGQVARVDLVLRTPKFREDQFRELFPAQPTTPDRPAPPTTDQAATQKPSPSVPSTPEKRTDDAEKAKVETKSATAADKDKAAGDKEKDKDEQKDKEKMAAAAKKATEVVFEDIRQRLGYLPVGVDVNALAISPDGKMLLLNASSEGQQNLYTYSLDELARERPVARQLTSTAGNKSDAHFSPDSKEVYYLEEGRIQIVAIERREPRPLAVTAELDVDFSRDRTAVFGQAWALLNEYFYDPGFHGISWTQARDRFAPYAAGASTPDELRRIGNLMIGELNASHLGMSAAPNPAATTTGRLGIRFDRAEYARTGRLAVADLIPLGPAAVTRAIARGDVLVAIDGTPIARGPNNNAAGESAAARGARARAAADGPEADVSLLAPGQPGAARGVRSRAEGPEAELSLLAPGQPGAARGVRSRADGPEAEVNLDRLLEHTIGKRVVLTIESKGTRRDVPVQPVNLTTERGLRYRQWVESRRAYVATASGGRLGYVHMPDMSAPSLAQLYVDLDAENHARDGVVIDLRNNNGGFVNAYALDVFTRRPYLNMTLRGRPTAPARTMLGQRALESPTILVTNQHSLSDAEDFTEGYRRLKLGKVVGEPTAGWIIYTWGTRLFDGSTLRLPRTRITDADGKDMELVPRPVDVAAVRQPGEVGSGRDTQLDAAVRELLAQIGDGARRTSTQAMP